MYSLNENITPTFERVFQRKKWQAFLTVGATCFVLLWTVYAASIGNLSKSADIEFSTHIENPNEVIQRVKNSVLSDASLIKLINNVDDELLSHSFDQNRSVDDLAKIRESIHFNVNEQAKKNQFLLKIIGIGSLEEIDPKLIAIVARRVTGQLDSSGAAQVAIENFEKKFNEMNQSIGDRSWRLSDELDIANSMLNDLNSELSEVYQAAELIRPNEIDVAEDEIQDREKLSELLTQLQQNIKRLSETENEREIYELGRAMGDIKLQMSRLKLPGFDDQQEGAMRVINASLPEQGSAVSNVLELLNQIDIDSIQVQIGKLKNNLESNAIGLREQLTELRTLAKDLESSQLVVHSIGPVRSGLDPNINLFGPLLLLAIFSTVVGAMTVFNYLPETEDIGFESVEHVKKELGVPIFAQFTNAFAAEAIEKPMPLANKLVRTSEMVLFGFVLLICLVCFIDSGIRDTFFAGPTSGLAHIAQIILN